jgi:signal transduction histidine kinase
MKYENIYKNFRILKLIEVAEDQIPETLKTVNFTVLPESHNIAAKHSGADCVQLSLQQQDQSVELIAEDHGTGFDYEKPLPKTLPLRGSGWPACGGL